MANNITDYLESALVKHLFRGVAYTAPASIYLALYTVTPGETGGGTEVTGGAYARKVLTTSPTGSSSFSDPGTSNSTSNSAVQTFATATADWGTVVAAALLDAATAGNMLWYGPLTTSRSVLSGDTFEVSASQLSIALD